MATNELPNVRRPFVFRRLVLAGLLPAFVLALVIALWLFDAKRECRGGAFSSGFSAAFDVRKCDLVVRRIGGEEIARIPLPR